MIGAFKDNDDNWVNKKWRPVMGWVYMMVNIADFILFPILWSMLQAVQGGQVTNQWEPLTLKGAGLFHIAMGAILGVTAWTRGQEKIAGVSTPAIDKTPGEPYLSDTSLKKPIQPSHPII
jgi:hypothetical protein